MADLIVRDLERREILVVGVADLFGSADERTDHGCVVVYFLQVIIDCYSPKQFVLFEVSAEIGEITQKDGPSRDSRVCATMIFCEAENQVAVH